MSEPLIWHWFFSGNRGRKCVRKLLPYTSLDAAMEENKSGILTSAGKVIRAWDSRTKKWTESSVTHPNMREEWR